MKTIPTKIESEIGSQILATLAEDREGQLDLSTISIVNVLGNWNRILESISPTRQCKVQMRRHIEFGANNVIQFHHKKPTHL